jgi:hypothetical protein
MRQEMNKFCFAFTLFVCTLFAVWAFPQQTTGNIEGTVLDPSGVALAGAHVTATDEATGKSREATSDDIGVFRLIQLLPGDYTLAARAQGFRGIRLGFTALPQNTTLPVAFNGCDGGESEIFCTDLNGDGTTGDLLPTASGAGAFGRSLKGSGGINSGISAYNSKFAGQLTPAGQLLVSQSLFTTSQLQSLGAFTPTIPLAPKGQASLGSLLVTDVRVAWHHKFGERVELEPSFDAFNVFNRSQFDAPGNELAGDLTGTVGHINGTLPGQRTNITQRGSGTFELGARRTLQAGLRISF